MISGTSKISLNIGPINGQIWTRGPRIYGYSYTENTSKHIRKYMGTSFKQIIFHRWTSENVDVGKDGHRKMIKIRPRIS